MLNEYGPSGNIDYKEFSIGLFGSNVVRGVQKKVDPEQLARK